MGSAPCKISRCCMRDFNSHFCAFQFKLRMGLNVGGCTVSVITEFDLFLMFCLGCWLCVCGV